MKKYLLPLVLLLVALAQCSFGQGSVEIIVQDPATGYTKPVSSANPLPVDAEVNIGSITVDVFPVFADGAGSPATATVDASNRAIVNIGSETIGMITAIDAVPTANYMDVENVSSATPSIIAVMSGRKSVSLFNQSTTETVWVSLDNDAASATIGIGIPLWPYGSLSVRLDPSLNVGLITSDTAKVTVYQDN